MTDDGLPAENMLFVMPPERMLDKEPDEKLSAGRRRTLRQQADLAAGRHPATGLPLNDTGAKCGSCIHHRAIESHRGGSYWHKCAASKLGLSHSEASDIRISWPACTKWEPGEEDE